MHADHDVAVQFREPLHELLRLGHGHVQVVPHEQDQAVLLRPREEHEELVALDRGRRVLARGVAVHERDDRRYLVPRGSQQVVVRLAQERRQAARGIHEVVEHHNCVLAVLLQDAVDLRGVERRAIHAGLFELLLRHVDADHVEGEPLVLKRLQGLVDFPLGACPDDGTARVGLGRAQVPHQQLHAPVRLARPAVADQGERAPPRVAVPRQVVLKVHVVLVPKVDLVAQRVFVLLLQQPVLGAQRVPDLGLLLRVDHDADAIERRVAQLVQPLQAVLVQLQHTGRGRDVACAGLCFVRKVHRLLGLHGSCALAVDAHDLGCGLVLHKGEHLLL